MLTFEPINSIGTNERNWQAEVGLLPYTQHVVFTKASLVEFLKTINVEVDSNGTEFKKLPKFATFGTLTSSNPSEPTVPTVTENEPPVQTNGHTEEPLSPPRDSVANTINGNGGFRPTRKVRELPGGGSSQLANILFGEDEKPSPNETQSQVAEKEKEEDSTEFTYVPPRPSRKVRELIGGGSSQISQVFA